MAAEREELDDLTSEDEDEDYGSRSSSSDSGTNAGHQASQLLAASEANKAGKILVLELYRDGAVSESLSECCARIMPLSRQQLLAEKGIPKACTR